MEQTEKMDRLEGLIKKYGPHSCGIYDLRNVDGDIEWLISEVERLKKALEDIDDNTPDMVDSITEAHKILLFITNRIEQALKEKDSEALLRNSLRDDDSDDD